MLLFGCQPFVEMRAFRERWYVMELSEVCPRCGDDGDKGLDATPHGDLLWVCQACDYMQ